MELLRERGFDDEMWRYAARSKSGAAQISEYATSGHMRCRRSFCHISKEGNADAKTIIELSVGVLHGIDACRGFGG